jgi:hypothetical protein
MVDEMYLVAVGLLIVAQPQMHQGRRVSALSDTVQMAPAF